MTNAMQPRRVSDPAAHAATQWLRGEIRRRRGQVVGVDVDVDGHIDHQAIGTNGFGSGAASRARFEICDLLRDVGGGQRRQWRVFRTSLTRRRMTVTAGIDSRRPPMRHHLRHR